MFPFPLGGSQVGIATAALACMFCIFQHASVCSGGLCGWWRCSRCTLQVVYRTRGRLLPLATRMSQHHRVSEGSACFKAQTGHSSECEFWKKQVMYQCFLSDNSDDIYVPTNYTFLKSNNILCMCFAVNYADARQKLSKSEVNSDLQS